MANEFDALKITNGKFTPAEGTAMDLGCTGSLSGETTTKTVRKICEGVPVKERTKPESMTLTFSGHLLVDAYRALFGFKQDDALTGKWAYGTYSTNANGVFTWDVEGFDGETKTMTFGNATLASGYAFGIENGVEEVAEVSLTITAMPDATTGDIYGEEITEPVVTP